MRQITMSLDTWPGWLACLIGSRRLAWLACLIGSPRLAWLAGLPDWLASPGLARLPGLPARFARLAWPGWLGRL